MPSIERILAEKEHALLVTIDGHKLWVHRRSVRSDNSLTPGGEEEYRKYRKKLQYPNFGVEARLLNYENDVYHYELPFYYKAWIYRKNIQLKSADVVQANGEGFTLAKSSKQLLIQAVATDLPQNARLHKVRFILKPFDHPLNNPKKSNAYLLTTILMYANEKILSACFGLPESSLDDVRTFIKVRHHYSKGLLAEIFLQSFNTNPSIQSNLEKQFEEDYEL